MLTLKEVAPYLPYGLKFNTEVGIYLLTGILEDEIYLHNGFISIIHKLDNEEFDRKPILRPLSDLTKEIEHEGEWFVPLIEIANIFCKYIFWTEDGGCRVITHTKEKYQYIIHDGYESCWGIRYCEKRNCFIQMLEPDSDFEDVCVVKDQFAMFQKLLEWHFDIFGLIERGDAVDINTLNEKYMNTTVWFYFVSQFLF